MQRGSLPSPFSLVRLQGTHYEERTSFEVPTVSLHVHERMDPRTIVEAVRRRNGQADQQMSLPFEAGKHKRVAVKIVDDRGIESLRILDVG